MPSTFKDVDLGWDAIQKDLKTFGETDLTLGWIDGKSPAHRDTDLSMSELAATHEFGTYEIPARPMLRGSMDYYKDAMGTKIGDVYDVILMNKGIGKSSIVSRMARVGKDGVVFIQNYMLNIGPSVWEPLKEATVKAKGFSDPLVDSQQLFDATTYQVTVRGTPQNV